MLAGQAEPVLSSVSPGLGRHRALVKIQDGCRSRCSYCLVSLVRGEERSLDEQQVVEAVRRRLDAGYREVVLCGINLGRYGLERGTSLARLLPELKKLREADSHWRLRLSSIEPMEWSAQLIEAIGECDFVCRHFHVPVQSGDDGVLKLMRRPYRAVQAGKVLEKLRRAFPQAALGSDLLVGFPGEDRAAFENTLDFARTSPLDYLHVFAFSPRPGTEAVKLSERVQASEVRGRVAELRALGGEKWRRFLQGGVGRRHLVLAEKCERGKAEGRSEHYRRVVFRGEQLEAGAMYEVYGEKVAGDTLLGRAINER
jgi:threonylcarbamoyladenosine tRNA methylthiotransferase MtaB